MLLTCLTFLVLGCQKDEQKNSALLINSWTRLYQASDASFNVKLSFNADGSFSWEMIDIVPTHSNSYAEYIASETEITISSDPECPGDRAACLGRHRSGKAVGDGRVEGT